MDFRCLYQHGAKGGSLNYCLWDPESERFARLESETLSFFSGIYFDQEKKVIFLHQHGNTVSGTEIYLKWIDGALGRVWEGNIPLREPERWDGPSKRGPLGLV